MKLYVASSWRNERYDEVCARLREAGHELLDWRETSTAFGWSQVDPHYKAWDGPGFIRGLEHPMARAGFEKDRSLMEEADACILLLPCGKSAHLEAGWFAGQGKPLFILLDSAPTAELMYGFGVVVTELEELHPLLAPARQRRRPPVGWVVPETLAASGTMPAPSLDLAERPLRADVSAPPRKRRKAAPTKAALAMTPQEHHALVGNAKVHPTDSPEYQLFRKRLFPGGSRPEGCGTLGPAMEASVSSSLERDEYLASLPPAKGRKTP